MGEGPLDRRLGDLVEHDAMDLDALQRPAPVQFLGNVPGDRLALAVRVGRKIEPLGALERVGDILDALVGPRVDLPGHGEAFVGFHRSVLGRQVAHVAVAGQYPIVLAEVLVDGLGLGRRFDDDDVHQLLSMSHINSAAVAATRGAALSLAAVRAPTHLSAREPAQDNWHSISPSSTIAPPFPGREAPSPVSQSIATQYHGADDRRSRSSSISP